MKNIIAKSYMSNSSLRCSHPINELQGLAAIEQFWLDMLKSFPNLERRDYLILGGNYEDKNFVGNVGVFCATFEHNWLSIPATKKAITLRFCETHEIKDEKIVQTTLMIDILDLMRQAGFVALGPSLGSEGLWLAPTDPNGLMLNTNDIKEGQKSLALVKAMHQSLFEQDKKDINNIPSREDLLSLKQKDYWHPQMMWYGPSGIGTTRSLTGFVDYHQRPFRLFCNNRTKGGNEGFHYVSIGDGAYSLTGGWPSFSSTHSGASWLGLPATGKRFSVRVMDFYYNDEGLIRENWVPIDILHILDQLDFDVIERMQAFFNPNSN